MSSVRKDLTPTADAEAAGAHGAQEGNVYLGIGTMQDVFVALETMTDGLAFTDADGRFTYMNRAHLEMFGFKTLDQVRGRPWSVLYPSATVAWFENFVIPHLTSHGSWQGEVTGAAADGSLVPQEVTLTLSQGLGGGIVCQTRNITARKDNERALERLRAFLAHAERRSLLQHKLDSVCHDIAGFLAVADARVQLARRAIGENPSIARELEAIEMALAQAGAVMRTFKVADSQSQSNFELDVVDLLEHVRDLSDLGEADRGRIRAQSHLAIATTRIDAIALTRAVLNLVRNALEAGPGSVELILGAELPHFAPPGVSRSRMGVQSAYRNSLVISVRDNGHGIDAAQLDRVFHSFFTTKRGEGVKGRGLGLDAVNALVNNHNCQVVVASAPGRGTQFSLIVPAEVCLGQRGRRVTRSLLQASRSAFVVDDDESWRELTAKALGQEGWFVRCFDSPEALVSAIGDQTEMPDCIIIDENFGALSGTKGSMLARSLAQSPSLLISFSSRAPERPEAFHSVVPKSAGVSYLLSTLGGLSGGQTRH